MIREATRSLETAASGCTPKISTSTGVISAPPPMPVRPTAKPTMRPASATYRSMCIPAGPPANSGVLLDQNDQVDYHSRATVAGRPLQVKHHAATSHLSTATEL